MKHIRTMTTIGGPLLTAAMALAQIAPTAPPPPAPPAALADAPTPHPMYVRAPRPAPAPPVRVYDMSDVPMPAPQAVPTPVTAPTAPPVVWNGQDWSEMQQNVMEKAREALDKAQSKMADIDVSEIQRQAMEKVQEAMEKSKFKMADMDLQFNDLLAPRALETNIAALADVQLSLDRLKTSGVLAQTRIGIGGFTGRGSDDSLYNSGLSDIDAHRYDQALANFNLVVSHAGARAEGGLYWKAYVLNKLGRSADAQAAIDQLRKTYPSSRWLDDAKALELEVKQAKGPVSADAETDEDIKILALNGLMQSDPEHALPQVENLLKTSHSPKLKSKAVTVIGMNGSPRARQILEQIARGGN